MDSFNISYDCINSNSGNDQLTFTNKNIITHITSEDEEIVFVRGNFNNVNIKLNNIAYNVDTTGEVIIGINIINGANNANSANVTVFITILSDIFTYIKYGPNTVDEIKNKINNLVIKTYKSDSNMEIILMQNHHIYNHLISDYKFNQYCRGELIDEKIIKALKLSNIKYKINSSCGSELYLVNSKHINMPLGIIYGHMLILNY